ncbi:MAG: asparagine synthase (glutamine-hydrolyzing) [Desulfobacterales bacterium]|nr:asparagine synthase (glutamine-hydrolyzing) [Desulfobacterales bacterium]
MCGINGIVHYKDRAENYKHVLEAMNQTIYHRGPDDEGYFYHENIGLAHRRLSIIDLSANAKQPMTNEDGTVWLVFNGEIYNYRELTQTLIHTGHRFHSRTDSEVIIHAYETWGFDFVTHLDGMFAFGLYDQKNGILILAKDRFGKKPIYYALLDDCFIFSSSLKAFKVCPMVDWRLDLKAFHKYLAYEYVPTPYSIIKGIKKLPNAHIMVVNSLKKPSVIPESRQYWSLPFEPKINLSDTEIVSGFKIAFDSAVQKRLMSDVPLGVFLSGGIDSSSVVASVIKYVPANEVKTFSVSFKEESFNESSYARLVARHFGTDHHEMQVEPEDTQEALTDILPLLDEPFADGSLIPTYLLSKFTRQHVTVALDGSGADEMLAGYDTFIAHQLAEVYNYLPYTLRKKLFSITDRLPASTRYMSFDFLLRRFLGGLSLPNPLTLELRDLLWLSAFTPDTLQSLCLQQHRNIQFSIESIFSEAYGDHHNTAQESLNRVVDHYIHLYHHDDILVKIDRASMMNSLEVRCPFLDTGLSEFMGCLPVMFKMHFFHRKVILKKAMKGILPDAILRKKKQGFALPVGDWLKTGLKSRMLTMLSPEKLKKQGLFNPCYVTKLVNEHLSGKKNNRKELWTLLMGLFWIEENKPIL